MTPARRAQEAPWPFNKHVRKRKPYKGASYRYEQYKFSRDRWTQAANRKMAGRRIVSTSGTSGAAFTLEFAT
jgi:hypothetical protein